jgi:hypothetical protein
MDIASLISIARKDFLNDAIFQKTTWDNAFFLRSFSEAQRQACNRTDFIFSDRQYITLRSGRANYTLPANITKLIALMWDNCDIDKVRQEQLPRNWRTLTGFTDDDTRAFMARGNLLTFVPKPDASDDGQRVFIESYIYPVDDFTSLNDEPIIPIEYHKKLIHWVVYEAYSNEVVDSDALDNKDQRQSMKHLELFNQAFGNPVSASVRKHQFENMTGYSK